MCHIVEATTSTRLSINTGPLDEPEGNKGMSFVTINISDYKRTSILMYVQVHQQRGEKLFHRNQALQTQTECNPLCDQAASGYLKVGIGI